MIFPETTLLMHNGAYPTRFLNLIHKGISTHGHDTRKVSTTECVTVIYTGQS